MHVPVAIICRTCLSLPSTTSSRYPVPPPCSRRSPLPHRPSPPTIIPVLGASPASKYNGARAGRIRKRLSLSYVLFPLPSFHARRGSFLPKCEDIDLHPQRQRFWHWWGVVASRQARASLSLSPTLNLANTSFSFPSTVPPASSSAVGMTSTQTPALRCRYVNGCRSTRVAPLCKSSCCKKHCIILNNGSCPLKTHDPATMSQRQRRDANVPPPLPARRRQTLFSPPPVASPPKSPVDGFSPSFLSVLDGISQQQSFGWDYGPVLQQARIDSPGLYLDQALHTGQSPLSPSLASSQDAADREDEELQLALTLSLASSSSVSLTPSSSASLAPSSSTSASSSSQAAPPPSQPWVPASSVAHKTTLPKPPRITTQLNPASMSQATGTRPANDTFAVRQPSARRAPVDLTTVQRFTLVYWDKVCALREPRMLF